MSTRRSRTQRGKHPDDRAGVIVFGREPAIEIPPLDEEQKMPKVESLVDREYTNMAGAMKLAEASFPHDSAKRIVIVSDGNENIGDALAEGRRLADAGVSIDVVPIRSISKAEVAVEKVTHSPRCPPRPAFRFASGPQQYDSARGERWKVSGRLQIIRKTGDREEHLTDESNEKLRCRPARRVYSIREEINAPDFYTYEARFLPDRPSDDTMPQNNQASTFTHVRGRGRCC